MNLQDKTRVHGELITGSLTIRDNTINDFINGPTLKWTNSSGFDLFGLLNINGYNVRVDFKGTNYDILTLGAESKDDPFLKIDKKRGVTLYNKTLTNISDIVELSPISASFNIKDKATFKVYGTIESTNETVECDVLGEIAPAGPSSFYSSQLTQDMSYKINGSSFTNYDEVIEEAKASNNSLTIAHIEGVEGLNIKQTTGSFSGQLKGPSVKVNDYVVFNVNMDHFDVYNKGDNTIKSSVAITGATFKCSPIFYNGTYYAIDSTGHIRKKEGEDLTSGTWEDKGAISTDGNEYFGLVLINESPVIFSNDATRSGYIIAYKSSGEPFTDSFIKQYELSTSYKVKPSECSVFPLGDNILILESGEDAETYGFIANVKTNFSKGGVISLNCGVGCKIYPKFYNPELILQLKIINEVMEPPVISYSFISKSGAVPPIPYLIGDNVSTPSLLLCLDGVYYFTLSNSSTWKKTSDPVTYNEEITGPAIDLGTDEPLTLSLNNSAVISNYGILSFNNKINGIYFLVNSNGTIKEYIIPSQSVQTSTIQTREYNPPIQTSTPADALVSTPHDEPTQTIKREGDILQLITKYKTIKT